MKKAICKDNYYEQKTFAQQCSSSFLAKRQLWSRILVLIDTDMLGEISLILLILIP